MDAPKLFISYSWSSIEHEQMVLQLATDLREAHIDVIIDKWDLKEGNDSIAFMEKMVTDPEIKKVLIISDQTYSEKADGRLGGVGTETQIISKEVYEQQNQNKFVAVITQKDENGKPYLPTFIKPRIYIDLSDNSNYAENYEKLLRWIHDKPLYVKPPIGEMPSFLNDDDSKISLGTSTQATRALEAIKNGRSYASGALQEYVNVFVNNLERFRILANDGEIDESFIKNIESFLPYRNEYIQIISALSQYSPINENIRILHNFFELLIPFLARPNNIPSWDEIHSDNFAFIIHELFIYTIAILLKHERFEQTNYLLEQKYYILSNSGYNTNNIESYEKFRNHLRTLEYRNQRLKANRISIHADLLKERCLGIGITFQDIMQADFLLYFRAEIVKGSGYFSWYPVTLCYLGNYQNSFEIFAKATSKKYFHIMKCILAVDSLSEIGDIIETYKNGTRDTIKISYISVNPAALIGYTQLCKSP